MPPRNFVAFFVQLLVQSEAKKVCSIHSQIAPAKKFVFIYCGLKGRGNVPLIIYGITWICL